MKHLIRRLSEVEMEAVAGGLQYNANVEATVMGSNPSANMTHLVVMPDPGFVAAPAKGDAGGGK